MKNILSFIEQTAVRFPDKIAIDDGKSSYTYSELISAGKSIGTYLDGLSCLNGGRRPVAVFMDKTPRCAAAFLGVVYSGNFYVVLDPLMPAQRVNKIFETLHPAAVITDPDHAGAAGDFEFDGETVEFEPAAACPADAERLGAIRASMTETDPLYALYTSGSTGRPKGTVISHRAVIAYSQWVTDTFGIDEDTVFGSQTPFYFSMSVTDLYGALRVGGRLQIIPRELFSFPQLLIEYMNKYKVNTIYWVPSALCIVANWKTFSYITPSYLKKVLFAGEVMPNKQLNYWRRAFPDVFFANLFGPTETTDICTYYVVDRDFSDDASLPIGRPCDNCDAFIVNSDGKPAESGELYVRGPFLASGYYNDPEKTAAAFVQNPLNTAYPETVYKTGDLVTKNEYGELMYLGRRDFQIKHMGYRIELGEIEAAAGAAEGVNSCVCCYDSEGDKIILFYQGKAKTDMLSGAMRSRLPEYMCPNKMAKLKAMPYNANGKIDRSYINKHFRELLGE